MFSSKVDHDEEVAKGEYKPESGPGSSGGSYVSSSSSRYGCASNDEGTITLMKPRGSGSAVRCRKRLGWEEVLTVGHLHHRSRNPSVRNTSHAPSRSGFASKECLTDSMRCAASLRVGARHLCWDCDAVDSSFKLEFECSADGEALARLVCGPSSWGEGDLPRFSPVEVLAGSSTSPQPPPRRSCATPRSLPGL